MSESSTALSKWANGIVQSILSYDYIALKNEFVTTLLLIRDATVRFSLWAYEHGSETAGPLLRQLHEWFWVAVAMTVFLAERGFHYAVNFAQWVIEIGADVINNFPTHWEKLKENVKFYWNNLK